MEEEDIELREILLLLWKWKKMIAVFLALGVAASLVACFIITPIYETSAVVSLGSFNSLEYNNVDYVKVNILAETNLKKEKFLADIIEHYGGATPRLRLQAFKDNISIEAINSTNIVKISVKNSNPETAVAIVDHLVKSFMEKSSFTYEMMKKIPVSILGRTEDEIANIEENIALVRAQMAELETENKNDLSMDQDLAFSRLQSVLNDYESKRLSLLARTDALQKEILSYKPAEVLERAIEPMVPISPNKRLILVIGVFIAACAGCFGAFVIEYLQANFLN